MSSLTMKNVEKLFSCAQKLLSDAKKCDGKINNYEIYYVQSKEHINSLNSRILKLKHPEFFYILWDPKKHIIRGVLQLSNIKSNVMEVGLVGIHKNCHRNKLASNLIIYAIKNQPEMMFYSGENLSRLGMEVLKQVVKNSKGKISYTIGIPGNLDKMKKIKNISEMDSYFNEKRIQIVAKAR